MSSTGRPKVYITRQVQQEGVDILKEHCDLTQWHSSCQPVPRDELMKNIAGVDGLFCLLSDKIDDAVLEAAGPNLKVIGTMSVGYDHIDMASCKKRNIVVGYTPEVLTDATAELAVALLLATSRRIVEGASAVKNGQWGSWSPSWMCGPGLLNSTVGIVGLGRIGLAIAKRLRPFSVSRILYTGHQPKDSAKEVSAEFTNLDTLLAESDFVVVSCAITPETTALFDCAKFAQMKQGAIFVNVSRGAVVVQEDLVDVLKNGVIRAAGLDVTTPEPLPTDSPLLTLPNCVVIPHIGSAEEKTRGVMAAMTARNILAVFNNQALPAQV
ncbi:Glyoxylate reductase/hydroxypyruvate reductase [Lamellibrachia satsuma]|nr:Glyoxylate reductase/hydroxypyruvate reductase [Lamellibrachia satsuma]